MALTWGTVPLRREVMRRTMLLVATALVAGALGCLDPRTAGLLVPATVADDPGLPSHTLRDGVKIHLEALGDPSPIRS